MRLLICVLASVSMLGRPAVSYAGPADTREIDGTHIVLPTVVNGCIGAACVAPVVVQRRDSIKNGAVIGAVVGGLALGGFAALVCTALTEEGNPPCWKGSVTIGAVGAGIGAAAGAGVDALMHRFPRLSPTVHRKALRGVARCEMCMTP